MALRLTSDYVQSVHVNLNMNSHNFLNQTQFKKITHWLILKMSYYSICMLYMKLLPQISVTYKMIQNDKTLTWNPDKWVFNSKTTIKHTESTVKVAL